ncbi:MAG: helix-turn-helix domain-containing protein [Anaerolineales bacterium]
MSKTDQWITTAEATKLTGYNNEHIRRLIRNGKIKAQKFGIVWQVDRDSILEYLQNEGRGPRTK